MGRQRVFITWFTTGCKRAITNYGQGINEVTGIQLGHRSDPSQQSRVCTAPLMPQLLLLASVLPIPRHCPPPRGAEIPQQGRGVEYSTCSSTALRRHAVSRGQEVLLARLLLGFCVPQHRAGQALCVALHVALRAALRAAGLGTTRATLPWQLLSHPAPAQLVAGGPEPRSGQVFTPLRDTRVKVSHFYEP